MGKLGGDYGGVAQPIGTSPKNNRIVLQARILLRIYCVA